MENAYGYLLLIMATAVIGVFISLVVEWRKYKTHLKVILIIFLVVQTSGTIWLFSNNWEIFPWGRAGAFTAADSFLATIKQDNYDKASEYMTPCAQRVAKTKGLGDQSKPSSISWQCPEYESKYSSASTIGIAKFSNSAELRVEIKMKWNRYKWEINGLIFGEPYDNPLIKFDCE